MTSAIASLESIMPPSTLCSAAMSCGGVRPRSCAGPPCDTGRSTIDIAPSFFSADDPYRHDPGSDTDQLSGHHRQNDEELQAMHASSVASVTCALFLDSTPERALTVRPLGAPLNDLVHRPVNNLPQLGDKRWTNPRSYPQLVENPGDEASGIPGAPSSDRRNRRPPAVDAKKSTPI